MAKTAAPSLRPLLVTTLHKGVFFGHGTGCLADKSIRLERAQMCVYWSVDVHGVFGLAATGPSKSCKVGPPVPELVLNDVTSVAAVTPAAVSKWEAAPWG